MRWDDVEPSEDKIQIEVINWSKLQRYKGKPLFDYLHHSPNGGKRATKIGKNGKRYSPEAAKFKRMGVKKGYPDLTLDIARGKYHGLRIELKKDSEAKVRSEQKAVIKRLNSEGYYAVVTRGFDETINTIKAYIKLGEFKQEQSEVESEQ